MVLVYQQSAHRFAEASEGKHADLVSDVLPSAGSLDALELGPEQLPHLLDPECDHVSQLLLPLCEQLLVVEDSGCYGRAVPRWA